MKKEIKIFEKGKYVTKEVNIIPLRYIIAVILSILGIVATISVVVLLTIYLKYFYYLVTITQVVVVVTIITSNENPDYKIPWLLFVIILPIVGFMLYFMFYRVRLPKRIYNKLSKMNLKINYDDKENFENLEKEDVLIKSHARELCILASTHLYQNTQLEYYSSGEAFYKALLEELNKAKEFIFLEFFIIEQGIFWNSILEILKDKVKEGVEVKVIYDDIGCMTKLPGNYYKELQKYNIDCVIFSKLRGKANGEFNNRSHRKIVVIDGEVAFTGGINLADEYINEKKVYGRWKDTGIKMIGDAVNEYTKLFLASFYINIKKEIEVDNSKYYKINSQKHFGYVIPFSDGPKPLYQNYIGKTVILNILNQAKKYVYITAPYLIVDSEMMRTIENTALRGVDVRIIIPHIPDKKLIFEITKENCQTLIQKGVKVYEYTPGFIHAKSYISDDNIAMIGTINLDYRSLTHHFENGVWIYKDDVVLKMKEDFINTINQSIYTNEIPYKDNLFKRMIRSIIKIFSPLL